MPPTEEAPDLPDGESFQALQWALVHTLTDATIRTAETLQEFYYHFHYAEKPEFEPLQVVLENALNTHVMIQEDLASLREILGELNEDLDDTHHEANVRDEQSSRNRFQAVFHAAPIAMAIVDDRGRVQNANKQVAKLFGVNRPSLRGRRLNEFIHEATRDESAWQFDHQAPQDSETIRITGEDGSERIVESATTIDLIPGHHLVVLRDVTNRVREQRRFEALSKGFPDLCFIIDEEGVYRDVLSSAASDDSLYADPDEFLEKSVKEVLPPEQASLVYSKLQTTLETGCRQTFEYDLDVPAGTRRFEARTYPLAREIDMNNVVCIVVRDITERVDDQIEKAVR